MDFPEPDKELLDQSLDIFSCQYSAAGTMLVVGRREPYRFDADPPMNPAKLGTFVETFNLASGVRAAAIGRAQGLESNRFGLCLPHPTRQWCLTSTWSNLTRLIPPGGSIGEDKQILRLWDMRSGQELARKELANTQPKTDPQISPDGTKIAFREASNGIPFFDIVIPDGADK